MATNETFTKYLTLRLLTVILIFPLVLSTSALKYSDPEEAESDTSTAMGDGNPMAVSADMAEMVSIPEPSTLLLFGASAAFLALFLRGKSAASKLGELGGLENLKEQKEQKEVGVANILK